MPHGTTALVTNSLCTLPDVLGIAGINDTALGDLLL
jgi:hypothetical protein